MGLLVTFHVDRKASFRQKHIQDKTFYHVAFSCPLADDEIGRILRQVQEAEGKEVPKVNFGVGEVVKILDGPFMNLTGEIDEIDAAKGTLKVSVSIFGRFTPVELEFWQVEKADEE